MLSVSQNTKTIEEDFSKLLLNNATVHTSMYYHKLGVLSEAAALKLAVITLAQQVEGLEDQIGNFIRELPR